MKLALALGLLLTFAAPSALAQSLELVLAPPKPAAVGQPQTFQVASVAGASGAVTYSWNFGDGEVSEPSPAQVATHVYAKPGHYTVIASAEDAESATSAVLVQTAYLPPTAAPPSSSSSIIFDAARQRVWSCNPDANSVSSIDARSLMRLHEVPVGKEPHSLAQAPDGSIWVANQGSDELVVLDPESGAELARIALPYASQPRGIAFGSSGHAYVSLFATGKLLELDPSLRQITREVTLGPTPAGVAVAADGRIFVTRFLSPADHGEVWVVAPTTFQLVKTIPLPFDPGPDTESSGRGVPNYVASMVISPDGTQAWISAKKDDVARGLQRDGQPMNEDNFVRSAVCTLDMVAEVELLEKRQDIDNRSMPVAVAFSPLGDYAFVSILTSNWFGVMDAYTNESLTGVKDVGHGPDGMVLLPDGRLFVNAFLSREVLAYDMSAALSSIGHAAPPPLARIPSVEHEPLSPQLLLGKQVYYNSADTRMGHAGYWSCASCHFGGYSDGRVWDFTDRGEGLRNTKSLLGIRGAEGQGRVHWSGNMDEIQDFERDIREAFDGDGFMPEAEFQAHLDKNGVFDPFLKPSAGVSPELDALSAYITSFDQVGRSPFRNADGSLSVEARAGRKIFERAGCPACHSGPDYTDSPLGLLHDVGTLLKTSGFRLGAQLQGLDTPTLKGLWQTAPYLHDGRAATLEDVFAVTQDHMGVVSNLSHGEIAQLVRFMLELDDVPIVEVPDVAPPDAMGTGGGMLPRESSGSCAWTPARPASGSVRWFLCLALAGLVRRRRAL